MEGLLLGIRRVDLFVFYGAGHPEGAVESPMNILPVDPQGDFLSGLDSGCPVSSVDELMGKRGEERLRWRVVLGIAGAPCGRAMPGDQQETAKAFEVYCASLSV